MDFSDTSCIFYQGLPQQSPNCRSWWKTNLRWSSLHVESDGEKLPESWNRNDFYWLTNEVFSQKFGWISFVRFAIDSFLFVVGAFLKKIGYQFTLNFDSNWLEVTKFSCTDGSFCHGFFEKTAWFSIKQKLTVLYWRRWLSGKNSVANRETHYRETPLRQRLHEICGEETSATSVSPGVPEAVFYNLRMFDKYEMQLPSERGKAKKNTDRNNLSSFSMPKVASWNCKKRHLNFTIERYHSNIWNVSLTSEMQIRFVLKKSAKNQLRN